MTLDPGVMEDLEVTCMDAIRGDPPGPGVARRLERECGVVLARHGLGAARVRARSDRRGTFVTILLPRPDRTVAEIRLTLQ